MSTGSKKEAISQLLGNKRKSEDAEVKETLNKGIGEYINKGDEEYSDKKNTKKVSFDFDRDFHTELKIFAARTGKNMVDVVIEATKIYMRENG